MDAKQHHIKLGTFITLFLEGFIVDGRGGGLVVGRSHAEGNIYLINQFQNDPTLFAITASVEGGEYLINYAALTNHVDRLHEINTDPGDTIEASALEISDSTRVINTVANPHDKLILSDCRGVYIVNKYSTAKHIEELERLNSSTNEFTFCDLSWLKPKDDTGG